MVWKANACSSLFPVQRLLPRIGSLDAAGRATSMFPQERGEGAMHRVNTNSVESSSNIHLNVDPQVRLRHLHMMSGYQVQSSEVYIRKKSATIMCSARGSSAPTATVKVFTLVKYFSKTMFVENYLLASSDLVSRSLQAFHWLFATLAPFQCTGRV